MRKAKVKKEPAGITEEFKSELNSIGRDDIQRRIVVMQKEIEETLDFLKTKQELVDLRDKLKMAEGPSKDTIKALKNRTKYALERLREIGAL